jgi:hypothetical protein
MNGNTGRDNSEAIWDARYDEAGGKTEQRGISKGDGPRYERVVFVRS